MAASEKDVQDAERSRLEAIVAEHASEREQFQLLMSAVMRNGITLSQYIGDEPLGYLEPEHELLARPSRRVERRAKLGLPLVECAGDPPTRHGCNCLERALDEPGDGGKRAVLKLAASFHWRPRPMAAPPRPVKEPTPVRLEAQERKPAATGPPPKPKPEPTPRVVHRVRRWYDRPEGPSGFAETKF